MDTSDVCYSSSPALFLALSPGWTLDLCALSPVLPLGPSSFLPDWVPWRGPGFGSSLALSGSVDGPCWQLLALTP